MNVINLVRLTITAGESYMIMPVPGKRRKKAAIGLRQKEVMTVDVAHQDGTEIDEVWRAGLHRRLDQAINQINETLKEN